MSSEVPDPLTAESGEDGPPLPRELLNDPEIRARIERARDRIRDGTTSPGLSVEEVLELARERRLDP